jgi:hypothetical protein
LSIERTPHFNRRIYDQWDVILDARENKPKAKKSEDKKVRRWMSTMDDRAQVIRAGQLGDWQAEIGW